jgi:DNA-binding beta-propeller fold protein YncE
MALFAPAVVASAAPVPAASFTWHRHVPGAPGVAPGHGWPGPPATGRGSLGTATVASTPVGAGPSELAIDPATHTIYVANGNNNNGPSAGGNTVSVIDTRRCQAQDVLRCRGPWPSVTVGNLPSSIAVDQATGTVYVTNAGDNTVSVFNGATCNATTLSGCDQQATVPVGLGPLGIFADDANHTVYVADLDEGNGTTVSMIDSATCNAGTLTTCPTTPPPTVTVALAPLAVTVDLATHTVYVSSVAQATVFDANSCNATVQSGCANQGTLPGDPFGNGPNDAEIDTADNTLYTANYDDTISALDLADCDAANLSGCSTAPVGTVSAFPVSGFPSALYVAVDIPLHTVYVTYQGDDSVAAVDTNVCNGANPAGCAGLHPPLARTGAAPQGVVVDPYTQTLYVANEIDNDVSVISASSCNATVTSGCSQYPSGAPVGAPVSFTTDGLAADPAVGTVYDTTGDAVAMVNTQTCNSHTQAGCSAPPAQFTAGSYPDGIAVDPLTHTVYVANFGSFSSFGPSSVSVVDADTCNATDQAGCTALETLTVPGGNADDLVVDVATSTLYVGTATAAGPDLVSVFNAATCNATDTAGCHQVPNAISFGSSGGSFDGSEPVVAVNQVTNTIYATDTYDFSNWVSPGLYVMNGATCDAAHTTGCNQAAVLMPLGLSSTTPTGPGTSPWGVAVDEATDSVYVALISNGDYAAAVAVVDGATCNGSVTSGCNQVAPQVPAGHNAIGISLDPFTHEVYTANLQDSSVSVVDGATCNGSLTFGCGQPPSKLPAAIGPASIVADPAAGTLYVAGLYALSVLPLVP